MGERVNCNAVDMPTLLLNKGGWIAARGGGKLWLVVMLLFLWFVYNAVSLLNFLIFLDFYMETYKHILEILTIN